MTKDQLGDVVFYLGGEDVTFNIGRGTVVNCDWKPIHAQHAAPTIPEPHFHNIAADAKLSAQHFCKMYEQYRKMHPVVSITANGQAGRYATNAAAETAQKQYQQISKSKDPLDLQVAEPKDLALASFKTAQRILRMGGNKDGTLSQ